MAAGLP